MLFETGTIPKRFWIGLMAFCGCAINFVLRSNISINILAMVLPQNDTIVLPDVRFGLLDCWRVATKLYIYNHLTG